MLLSWNYTLELFFWIVVGAVALVSLTILLAKPKFRAKATELSENTLSLTGKNVDSYNQKKVSKKTNSSRIEEDGAFVEENKRDDDSKKRVSFYTRMKAYCIILLYVLYSSFVVFYGALILYWEIFHRSSYVEIRQLENLKPYNQLLQSLIVILFGITFSLTGISSFYGFIIENKKWLKFSCRITASTFLLLITFIAVATNDFFSLPLVFVIIPLIFSGDLKMVLSKIYRYDNYDVSLWWVGVPAGVLCLFLVIAIFGPLGFVLFSVAIILVTIYINLN